MRCPVCSHNDSRVIDSRIVRGGLAIRRRRECPACAGRFTSYETIEDIRPSVIKKDKIRDPFDRQKLIKGIERACQKRPVSRDDIEAFVDGFEAQLVSSGRREIPGREIGEAVMIFLRKRDKVAYVRFASVYRDFEDVGDFVQTVQNLANDTGASKIVSSKPNKS